MLLRRTDLDSALSVKENIIRLDVSMDDALAMQMPQSSTRLEKKIQNIRIKT